MIRELKQTPHPAKAILVNELKVPISSISKYLGITYPYTCTILSGLIVTKKHDKKLFELIEKVKKEQGRGIHDD